MIIHNDNTHDMCKKALQKACKDTNADIDRRIGGDYQYVLFRNVVAESGNLSFKREISLKVSSAST